MSEKSQGSGNRRRRPSNSKGSSNDKRNRRVSGTKGAARNLRNKPPVKPEDRPIKRKQSSPRARAAPPATDPAAEFRLGLENLAGDNLELAAKSFERAFSADKANAEYMSYYGLCSAIKWGRIGKATTLCTKAIKIDFKRPDFYLNLGRVYLKAGNRKGAATVFKKGLGIDPSHKGLHDILISMGIKEEALLPFLSRAHPINKRLGIFIKRRLPSLLSSKGPKKKAKDKG